MEEKRFIKRKEKAMSDGNREQLAISCNHLADFYNQQGKYKEAVREYEQEAHLYEKLGKRLEMARAKRMMGEMYMLIAEFNNAKEHVNDYLKIVQNLENKVEEQRAYATLGRLHLLHGQSILETCTSLSIKQFKLAEKGFLRSLLLIKEISGQVSKIEQLDMQARCYLNIGVVKEHMEDFEESVAYIEKAIKISKTHDLFELTHLCYISMSLLYNCKSKDSTSALRYCNLALEVAKRLPNKVKKICETLLTKSEILIKVGDFASVKQILTKAYKKNTPDENDRNTIERTLKIVVKICKTLDELVTTSSVDYAKRKDIYERLGDSCCHLMNFEKGIEYYLKMLENAELDNIKGKSLVPIYVSLYQTYKDNKQYDKALEYLWKEFELNRDVPKEAFFTLCSIAEVCELQAQPFWNIHDIYQKAREQATKIEGKEEMKLEKIAIVRLKRLMLKHGMDVMAAQLIEEAQKKGIITNIEDGDDSDNESETMEAEQNTPEWDIDEVCLDDLTDSGASDLDETEKPRPHRVTRGSRTLVIKRNNKGETPLHEACIAGNLELVRRLIEQGHTVNVRDHAGWLPLHEACNHGYRDIVEYLLAKGAAAAINDKGGTSCDGITPLFDACSNGYLDVVELLLNRGADATVRTDNGETCVNGLDKWRATARLVEGEQEHYIRVRDKLLETLSKVGICNSNEQALTNDNVNVIEYRDKKNEDTDTDSSEDDSGKLLCKRKERAFHYCLNPRNRNIGKEYKNVMEQMKRPKRILSSYYDNNVDDDINKSLSSKQKRNGFLDDDEVEEEDWLVNDIEPERKKQCYNMPMQSKEVNRYIDCSPISWEGGNIATSENDAFQVLLDTATSSTAQHWQKQKRKLSLSRTSNMSSNSSCGARIGNKLKQQVSLLDTGFSRVRSESPIQNSRAEPDSTTTTIQLVISPKKSPIHVQTMPIKTTTVSFKVKVENELLLIPVERKKLGELTIRWLSEEAARRYNNLIGMKPVLRLKTNDGFAFEDDDSLSVAIEHNIVVGTALSWLVAPLAERYVELCNQLELPITDFVKEAFEKAQVSGCVEISYRFFPPPATEPFFKALLHQTFITTLEVTFTSIQCMGIIQFAAILPTLPYLKKLDIRSNCFYIDAFRALLTCPNIDKLKNLEALYLSHNRLGNECISVLSNFCKTAAGRNLRKLRLARTELTSVQKYDLNYEQLILFDISYNELEDEAISFILSKLNSSQLENLNLNYCSKRADLGKLIVDYFERGTCKRFKKVRLADCQLTDVQMQRIALCLSNATNLEYLDISENKNLGSLAMQSIINYLPQLQKLRALYCPFLLHRKEIMLMGRNTQMLNLLMVTLIDDENGTILEKMDLMVSKWQQRWSERAKWAHFSPDIETCFYLYEFDLHLYNH